MHRVSIPVLERKVEITIAFPYSSRGGEKKKKTKRTRKNKIIPCSMDHLKHNTEETVLN